MVLATAEVLALVSARACESPVAAAPAQSSEAELIRRSAAGDMDAFGEIYRRYHRIVYSLCLRMTRNQAEAEDLTQEVFLKIFRKLASFRGEAALATWIHRVTVNGVLMHFRRVSARREHVTDDGTLPVERPRQGLNALTAQPAERVTLELAIARLPPGYRLVFVLHDVEGYEHEEIARLCGIAVGTSKSQLHKARLKLRRLLQPARQNLSIEN